MRYLLGKKRLLHFDLRCRRLYGNPVSVPQSRESISDFAKGFGPESWGSMEGLVRCSANYEPLSPMGFFERTAKVSADKTSVVYGSVSYTWGQTYQRCLKLASALVNHLGINRGDIVAVLAPNVPAMYELHFAVPMAGAVLSPLNTLLDPAMVALALKHSEAKVLFVDDQFFELAQTAFSVLAKSENAKNQPILILISQPDDNVEESIPTRGFTSKSFDCEYESLLDSGSNDFEARKPRSEWDPISINYTSGTTSRSKGVVSSHRGAYVNSLATAFLPKMGAASSPVYLWTVPMFHANGWSLTWGMAAQGGTNVCIREVSAKSIFNNITKQKVTHMGAGPAILNMIVNSPMDEIPKLSHSIEVFTGGSPPPIPILTKMVEMGFNVSHVYGLTEITGPGTYCESKPAWDVLPANERSRMKARQGLPHLAVDEVDVKDPVTMKSVPSDGKTIGEIMFRGNNVMLGYFKDPKATQEAFRGGWFHTSDLAVKHPDGHIEIKDRKRDLIVSGGKNVSTVEIEWVLYSHQAVLEAAVVGRPDNHFDATPCAFVKLKDGFDVKADEMIEFCGDHLEHYKVPKTVVFGDLPRTSTGKVQKYLLRKRAKAMGPLS